MATPAGIDDAARLAASFGASQPAEPSLEDVFVSLARQHARGHGEGDVMKRLLALTWKELLQLKRDPHELRMIVMVPLMQLLIFGYAINYDVKHLKTVVLDESRSYESRELVAKMDATDYFDIVGRVDSFEELQQAIDSAQAVGRPGHRSRLRQGPPPRRAGAGAAHRQRLGLDDVDSRRCRSSSGIASGMSVQVARRSAPAGRRAALPVDMRVRPWYNPELKTSNFIIPGLIAIVLTFTLIQFTASSIVKERELGTLEQLQVTPITRTS